jgi:bla regulator protein BlaR1
MINYILQVILFQVLFLAIYDFFLSKETFFIKNRWYLVSTPMLSFLIPFIKIPSFQRAVPQELVILLPEIVLNPDMVIQQTIQQNNFKESINYINILFWVGVVLFSVLFLIKLVKVINFIRKHQVIRQDDFNLILIPNETKAFSFFNYVFLGESIKEINREKIIQHELVHARQKHSLDLLFFELLKIIMWFNPMIYFYQQRITLVHEYISDAIVGKSENKETYINNLLSTFFQVENISFINQFYKQSFIKKRILMMTKTQSKKMNQIKYLLLIPVLMCMLFYTACSDNHGNSKKEIQTLYRINNDNLISFKGNRISYLDNFIGGKPTEEMIEISFEDLSKNEKEQYNNDLKSFKKEYNKKVDYTNNDRFFKMPNGRISVGLILEGLISMSKDINEINEISFLEMEKTPIFPGCEHRDFDCFFKELDNHFTANFNMDIIDDIFISSGKKKILVDFSIDTKGEVVDVKVKSPHLVISEEVKRVIYSLPKMSSGEKFGIPIKAKYSLPFTILID